MLSVVVADACAKAVVEKEARLIAKVVIADGAMLLSRFTTLVLRVPWMNKCGRL
jgi:hypothetical protein